ncbi:hypothetical protein EDB89DRAFT_2013190 [Lactarius sanguifluus]|nr:hypothetical protein EDB89DRAFT_2013190 [Lactarius sanguifluus]
MEMFQNKPKIIDSSAPLFLMYNERAKERDKKMLESWNDDAKAIIIFTGLFLTITAQFLLHSFQNLQKDEPATSDIWICALWVNSFLISLLCGLITVLVPWWSCEYERAIQEGEDPQTRARIREFMRLGSKTPSPRFVITLLYLFLHLSVFLFVVGFIIKLVALNHLVAMLAATCTGSGALLYLHLGLVAIISHDSPYRTPLTTLIWVISIGAILLLLRFRDFISPPPTLA